MSIQKFCRSGIIDPEKIALAVNARIEDIAYTAGLEPYEFEAENIHSSNTQARLRELVEILNRLQGKFGSFPLAFASVRSDALNGFSGQTAMHLIQNGHARSVLAYVDATEDTSYA